MKKELTLFLTILILSILVVNTFPINATDGFTLDENNKYKRENEPYSLYWLLWYGNITETNEISFTFKDIKEGTYNTSLILYTCDNPIYETQLNINLEENERFTYSLNDLNKVYLIVFNLRSDNDWTNTKYAIDAVLDMNEPKLQTPTDLIPNPPFPETDAEVKHSLSCETEEVIIEDEDKDTIDDIFEESNERVVNLDTEVPEITIETELKNAELKNKLKAVFKTENEGFGIELEFKSNNQTDNADLLLNLSINELVEYIDLDGDNVYRNPHDTIVQSIPISSFDEIQHSSIILQDGTKGFKLSAETSNHIFKAEVLVVESFSIINNRVVTPNALKIDFTITNFHFLETQSRLALGIKLESSTNFEFGNLTEDEIEGIAQTEAEVRTNNGNFIGFFSWLETAIVDDKVVQVLASPFKENDPKLGSQKFFLNYPQGSLIIHDPKLGIGGIILKGTAVITPVNLLEGLNLTKEGLIISTILFSFFAISVLIQLRNKIYK